MRIFAVVCRLVPPVLPGFLGVGVFAVDLRPFAQKIRAMTKTTQFWFFERPDKFRHALYFPKRFNHCLRIKHVGRITMKNWNIWIGVCFCLDGIE